MELKRTCCRTYLGFLLLVFAVQCRSQTDFPLPSQPSGGMTVDSGGGVFLAAGSQLFRLDRNFAFQENVTLGSDILKIALSNDGSRLVVCLSDESCDVYNASDFSAGPQLTIEGAAASMNDIALFTSPGDSFYVGSFGEPPSTAATDVVFLTQYGFGNSSFTRESGISFSTITNNFMRTFYSGFVQDMNAYYFVIDTSDDTDVRGLRVLRVCNIAECAEESGVCEVNALYEVALDCTGLGVIDSRICGVSLLENIAGSAVKTIVLSVCAGRNRICSFNLTEIDTAMDDKYTECSGGTGSNVLVWGGPSRPCADFQARDVCDFNPALATSNDVFGPNRVSISGFMDTITASLAITVEDTTSLLYVGTTTMSGGNHFLTMYHLTSDCTINSCTDIEFNTIPMDSAVRQLQWQDGLDYIYVATDTLVTQVPLEECSTYTDCDTCISHGNPLCGWCTVEEKCSRRSQCQNATGTMRWEQNITECITIDVTPNQFVLNDQDNNVTLTVSSPGLPPLLDGESYRCHFRESGGGGIEFTTEATEVTNNTVYTCDLNGTIPAFSGVKLATDVSFISSLVGVPFGTRDNALTIYNCPTATSCSQCVETENACGWCIYNKLCSGTADSCTNSSDAYWYRLNGTSSSSEVCPLLEPADINLDGDYVQPVMVDRDLVLNTTNLPQPISGFRYVCSLGSTELETVYVSENSLTCQVDENDIVFSSVVSGEERVSLSVLWVSDDGSSLPHPIDTRNGNQINVDLYSCMDLGTSCSLCLAANTGTGFDCGWCSNENTCDIQDLCSSATSSEQCPVPTITSFSPSSGPPTGGTIITISGTDLGVTYSDVANRVFFDGNASVCETLEDRYVPGEQIVCITQDFGNIETPKQVPVTVILEGPRVSTTSQFSVETPNLTGVDPEFGPVSGGTAVVVSGDSLRVGNRENTNITVNGIDCAIQDIENVNATQIMCSSMAFDGNTSQCDVGPEECLEDLSSCSLRSVSSAVGPVVINIDGSPFSGSGVDFEFRCDPRILCASPQNTIPSGGVRLTFSGCGMDVGQRPLFVVTDNAYMPYPVETECVVTSDTSIECLMPRLDGSVSFGDTLSYEIRIDGVTGPDFSNGDLQVDITVERDPEFPEGALVTTNFADIIEIKGMNLDSVDQSEINVTIGGVECEIRGTVTAEEIFCDPPTQAPGGITEAPVMVTIGQNLNFSLGLLSYAVVDDSNDDTIIEIGTLDLDFAAVVGVAVVLFVILVLIVLVLVIFIIVCLYRSKTEQREKQLTNLLAQMELLEIEMADECKRAFTELQTDLADLVTGEFSADKNLPYRDFRSFAMRFLFPSAGESHPALMPLHVPAGVKPEEMTRHIENFRQLVMEKKFLLVFVRTLEAQHGSFGLQDKCNVASYLMIAFQNDLDYATDILQTLLSELMRRAVTKSHPKLLLRATESVAEKMLANWLCFLLFPYILEHAGEPLFILFRAIKSQLEKGPVDILTGDARHSLSEEKLLRHHLDVKLVEGVVETEGGEEVPIKLLDCDSITQAKEKILDALYKNTPVSKRPQLTEVDLELRRMTAGVALRDQDQTNIKDGEWTKVNTLGHYRLQEMSQAYIDNPKNPAPRFKLVRRPERPVSGMSFDALGTIIANINVASQRGSLFPSELNRVYHLVKPELGESDDTGPRQGQKIMSEVFLTRLLSTKRILQPYVDDLFHAIFAVPRGRPLPKAIKYLFDFLDLQAAELGIQEADTVHTWKTNSLPLRFWVNNLKNPDFIFDINKSATVDSCLTVITQAYIDACSTSELKYTKDTPSARLLYVNEVKNYKAEVHQYYDTIQSLPKLSQYEMQEYLRETAQVCADSTHAGYEPDTTRQLYFVTESALFELFKFASRYSDEIVEALNEEGLSTLATNFEQLTKSLQV